MSNSNDLQTKLDVLQAIPNDDVLTPTIPVDVFLQEAENLYHWCLTDKAELTTVGISEAQIIDLPVRAGALREAQSLWFKQRYSQEEAQREWGEKSPLAYDLRDELIHVFRYAYRDDSSVLGRVAAVADGNSLADMIQDLNDLAVLGRENADALNAIGFDMTKLDAAATRADELADLLATANGDKEEQSESKVLRDKAYTHVKELVDNIREAGKFLFWKNPRRLKGYSSRYWKKKNNQNEPSISENAD